MSQEELLTFQPPTWESLKQQALSHFKGSHRKEYRELKQNPQELEEYLESKAYNTKSYAESLQRQGVWAGRAWEIAVREVILGVPAD